MVVIMEDNVIIPKMYELAKLINYQANDISYLKKAMYCQRLHNLEDGKNRKKYTNDSLATLGDAVLKLILSEYFFDKGYDKAEITKEKEKIENGSALSDLCSKSKIIKYAYNNTSFFDDAPQNNQVAHPDHDPYIEAIIAAIYKDKGFDYCKNWVIEFFTKNNCPLD